MSLTWSEVGKDLHGLDIPHLQLHGEESEPIFGSSRETHCPNDEGSGLILLLLSDVSSKVTRVRQTFCSDAPKHPPEPPAVTCSVKAFLDNCIVLLFTLELCAGKTTPVSHAASGRTLNSTCDSAELRAGGSYFGPQCYSLTQSQWEGFSRCIWAANTFCCQQQRKFLEVMKRNSKTVPV